MVDVEQGRIVFDQDRQPDAPGMDEVGAAVSEGVGLELRRDVHGEALALSGLAIPGLALRFDPCQLPHGELAHVGAGLVAARDKRVLGLAMRRSAATALSPLIFAASAAGPMITKSLYMTSRREVPFPWAIQAFSASGEWVSSTSPSPRAPCFKISPLPATIAFTAKPDFLAKASVRMRKIRCPAWSWWSE